MTRSKRRLLVLETSGELERVKLLYTISEHSNPTGLSLLPERRRELVETARRYSKRHRLLVIEDAAYRGLTYEGTDASSVWSHDTAGTHVVHCRTFSKTFSPGLKVGLGNLARGSGRPDSELEGKPRLRHSALQPATAGAAASDVMRTTPCRARSGRRIGEKRDAMLSALETHMGPLEGAVRWTHPRGGLYVWLTVPEGIDMGPDGPIFNRCLEEGVLYVPGALAYPARARRRVPRTMRV